MQISLKNRLMAFFLVALAGVLTAFSFAIYFFAKLHLNQQLEDRAGATLETLVAASEVHPNGLEWQPDIHKITFWHEDQPTIWAVFDQSGTMIDCPPNQSFPVGNFSKSSEPVNLISQSNFKYGGQDWRVFQIKLDSGHSIRIEMDPLKVLYKELVFMTAWPLKSQSSSLSLKYLSWTLILVAGSAWGMAAVLGRWFCQKALLPLSEMTRDVDRITADQLSYRLKPPSTRDELQSLSEAFNELMDRLELSFAKQSRFTSEASHQMRTPLTALMGQLDVALRRDRDTLEYKRVLTSSRNQVVRLQKIVELLLFLARADAESKASSLEWIELTQWLKHQLKASWGEHLRYPDIKLEFEDHQLVHLQSHSAMLTQAIDNFMDNAMKYSEPGTAIMIRLINQPDTTIIEVEDHGKGIKESDLSQVFDPFFRSSDNRNRGVDGFGLGLAIVARIASALDADYSVRSKLGEGSIFQLAFHHNTSQKPIFSNQSHLS